MDIWTTQDAKAKFSELLDTCVTQGAQLVTRRGQATAVLIPMSEWTRLNQTATPSLRELLSRDEERFELGLPDRAAMQWRDIEAL